MTPHENGRPGSHPEPAKGLEKTRIEGSAGRVRLLAAVGRYTRRTGWVIAVPRRVVH